MWTVYVGMDCSKKAAGSAVYHGGCAEEEVVKTHHRHLFERVWSLGFRAQGLRFRV